MDLNICWRKWQWTTEPRCVYSQLSLKGHLCKTDTSLKWTLGGGLYHLFPTVIFLNLTVLKTDTSLEWTLGGGLYHLFPSVIFLNLTVLKTDTSLEWTLGGGLYCLCSSVIFIQNLMDTWCWSWRYMCVHLRESSLYNIIIYLFKRFVMIPYFL